MNRALFRPARVLRAPFLILVVSFSALADIPPPLWAPRCTSVEGCTSCFTGDEVGYLGCADDAKKQGFELVCTQRRTQIYCPPGRALVAHAAAWFVPGVLALAISGLAVSAGLFVRRRRRSAS